MDDDNRKILDFELAEALRAYGERITEDGSDHEGALKAAIEAVLAKYPRALTSNQQAAYVGLKFHGAWQPDSHWVIDNVSTTKRVMESLVKRGLVYPYELQSNHLSSVHRNAKGSFTGYKLKDELTAVTS